MSTFDALVKEWTQARLALFDEINNDCQNIERDVLNELANAECALYKAALTKWNKEASCR